MKIYYIEDTEENIYALNAESDKQAQEKALAHYISLLEDDEKQFTEEITCGLEFHIIGSEDSDKVFMRYR